MGLFDRFRTNGTTGARNSRTSLNPDLQGNGTVLNPSAAGNATTINDALDDSVFIAPGMTVCGQYVVQRELDVNTGEADLFVCTCEGKEYIAKIYRRQLAIKPEVAKSLSDIRSPYVARVYVMGEYRGYPVEILPYYKKGSLQGKTFNMGTLRQYIIPSLNMGLKALHDHGIIHKDLKPSNIMLNDDGRTVSIIDFGISSVAQAGNTVVVTHTGLTPEYSAPETFRNLFLAESDYYSLGITLYELYTGHSPYDGMTQEQIAQFAVIQKVPLPEDMDESLKKLITGLTYNDITNRRDKNNPNRRWTYDEVKNWCSGIDQPVPGSTAGDGRAAGSFRAFRFNGKEYGTMDSLVTALGSDWQNGKKQLFRGILGGHFNSIDADIANICYDAQDELDAGKKSDDRIFFETLYKLNPHMPTLFWKGQVYPGMDALGQKVLAATRKGGPAWENEVGELLQNGLLSAYIAAVEPDAKEHIRAMQAFESEHRTFKGSPEEKERMGYRFGYMLATNKNLVVDGKSFRNPDELVAYMQTMLTGNPPYKDFEALCGKLIDKDDVLDVQFECWLESLGKKSAIEEWRSELVG